MSNPGFLYSKKGELKAKKGETKSLFGGKISWQFCSIFSKSGTKPQKYNNL